MHYRGRGGRRGREGDFGKSFLAIMCKCYSSVVLVLQVVVTTKWYL